MASFSNKCIRLVIRGDRIHSIGRGKALQFEFLGVIPKKVKIAANLMANIFCFMTVIKVYMAYTVANIVLYKPLRTFPNCQKGQCTTGR